jgi:four helix bundle protein
MAGEAPKKIESHRDLIVWQKAMDLVVQVYGLTGAFPPSEIYRLVAQVTRAAASVPANIAEGHARSSRKDFANFLAIARGSLMETETFLMLAIRLGYLQGGAAASTLELIVEISKMLTVLRQKLLL